MRRGGGGGGGRLLFTTQLRVSVLLPLTGDMGYDGASSVFESVLLGILVWLLITSRCAGGMTAESGELQMSFVTVASTPFICASTRTTVSVLSLSVVGRPMTGRCADDVARWLSLPVSTLVSVLLRHRR